VAEVTAVDFQIIVQLPGHHPVPSSDPVLAKDPAYFLHIGMRRVGDFNADHAAVGGAV